MAMGRNIFVKVSFIRIQISGALVLSNFVPSDKISGYFGNFLTGARPEIPEG